MLVLLLLLLRLLLLLELLLLLLQLFPMVLLLLLQLLLHPEDALGLDSGCAFLRNLCFLTLHRRLLTLLRCRLSLSRRRCQGSGGVGLMGGANARRSHGD